MSDKFDVVAENLADNDGKLYRHEIAQYLREQFAVKVSEDVKELVRKIQSGLKEWYPIESQGKSLTQDESISLVSSFVQSREKAAKVEECEKLLESKLFHGSQERLLKNRIEWLKDGES